MTIPDTSPDKGPDKGPDRSPDEGPDTGAVINPDRSVERVLQRVVLPLDADNDVLPLYVDGSGSGKSADEDEAVETDPGQTVPTTAPTGDGFRSSQVSGRRSAVVPDGTVVSFGSYFNGFPAGYWRRWSTLSEVVLRVVVRGSGSVTVYRSTSKGHSHRVESRRVDGQQPVTMEILLPLKTFIDGGWYWFDLAGDGGDLRLDLAEWLAHTDDTAPGTLTIGVTSFNRPTFCVDQLVALAAQPDVLTIVDEVLIVDQGSDKVTDEPRFAEVAQRLGSRLRVVEQPNLGGSGGFSRAMDETVTRGDSDYCLLLDDDVVCEPEGILRAATFADLARTPTIVGGQMLSLYDRCVLHAYGEAVAEYRWFWGPAPGTPHGHDFAANGLRGTPWMHRRIDVDYNGWWMCLIPTDVIRKVGLSLPMFIKWDDAEFGLRARVQGHPTVTLPGVAVWHVPWHEKDDTIDWQAYWHRRNRVAAALLHSPYARGGRLILESFETQIKHLVSMQYSAAELGLLAIEDLLEGPQRMHRDVRLRMAELRAIRATYADSQSQDDLEKFPPARRPKPPRRGVQPRPPRSKPALLKSAALGSVRQLMPVRETSRRNPEMAVPHVFLQWWRLAKVDSALVSGADGASAAWYQRDRDKFRALLARSVRVHLLLWQRWDELAKEYRAALPELTAPQTWRETISTTD